MDKKKSFIVFAPEFLALSNHLNLKQRGELMTALCEMVLYGEPMKPVSQEISKAYDFMAESIKDNFSKYDAVCEKRRAIATKAASKRRANAEQKQAEKSANAKLNEDEDDNENKHEDDLNQKIKKEIKEKTNKKESSYHSTMPDIIYTPQEIAFMDRKPIKIRPTTEQITQMDEVLEWLEVLDPWERKLVWKRGARIPWKVLSYEFGLHRSNLSRHYEKALVKILLRIS